jgi:hypothetical protein
MRAAAAGLVLLLATGQARSLHELAGALGRLAEQAQLVVVGRAGDAGGVQVLEVLHGDAPAVPLSVQSLEPLEAGSRYLLYLVQVREAWRVLEAIADPSSAWLEAARAYLRALADEDLSRRVDVSLDLLDPEVEPGLRYRAAADLASLTDLRERATEVQRHTLVARLGIESQPGVEALLCRIAGRAAGAAALPALLQKLATASEARLWHAVARGLAEAVGPTAAVAAVIERLAAPELDAATRQSAAHVLGILRRREGVPALLALLGDPSPRVREATLDALGSIRDPDRILPALEAVWPELTPRERRLAVTARRFQGADPSPVAPGTGDER